MSRIAWDGVGSRFYEVGLDRGVLYIDDQPGVPWNGLTSVTENVSGGTAKPYYIDGQKYSNNSAPEEFSATLTAFTYPDEFAVCDGTVSVRNGLFITKQRRKPFSLSYRNMVGNDLSSEFGYKIHLIYNAYAAPATHAHKSSANSTNADDFSWALTALPPVVTGYWRSAHLVLDSRNIDPSVLSDIEDILYGNDVSSARLPDLAELADIIDTSDVLTVVDNGDGTYTLTAPMADLIMLDADTFQLTWPTATFIDSDTYTISS